MIVKRLTKIIKAISTPMYEDLPFVINSVLLSGGFMSFWHRVVNNTNTFTNFFLIYAGYLSYSCCWHV